jgi:hypothetical protein
MPQDAHFTTARGNDPKANKDAAWAYLEQLRDPSCGAGLDEEELFGGLGESAQSRGLFITPNPSRQTL